MLTQIYVWSEFLVKIGYDDDQMQNVCGIYCNLLIKYNAIVNDDKYLSIHRTTNSMLLKYKY